MKPGHLVAALGMSLLLSGFADPAPRLEANDGAPDTGQPASVRPASPATSSDSPDTGPMTARDAVRAASVASPYRISEQAAKGTIRYRIEMHDGVPWPWPETGEQHVEQDGSAVVLTVCTTCGQEAPPTASGLQRDLQPNHWADSNDRVIRQFAGYGRAGNVDRTMRQLVDEVQKRIDGPVYFGRYRTSREAYEDREGDCVESALLLAAGAKARHIPVRVAFGMAYASRFLGQKRMFGPHMWVQAWDGRRWTSYDAGLGEFDSTHIVLALGDGRPDGVAQVFAKLRDVRIVSAEGVLPALAAGP
ncbi:MAG TPA: transglutaminase domain-containing protein [Xanthomonadaceae bacterium]